MKIYIDLIIIINFFIDLVILIGLGSVLKYQIKILRLLIASFLGSLSTFILLWNINFYISNIVKLIISIVIIITCYGKNNILKKLLYFYLISIILGGVIYLIDINYSVSNILITILILVVCCPIIIFIYVKSQLNYKSTINSIYNVVLFIDNKKYILRGLLDTGNTLRDPYKNRAVILLNNNIMINKVRFIMIPYKALNYEGVVKCIKPDKVIVNEKVFNNCLIGISNNKLGIDIDCILPNKFMEDL